MPDLTADQLVTLRDPHNVAAEAYRTLRTNIRFRGIERPVRSLLFTSPGQQEGKSTTLANLAVLWAQAGTRVIAVDCDLRRPALHTIFGTANTRGLTSCLVDEPTAPIPVQDVSVPGLRLLPSGPQPPNPAELLTSERVDRVLAMLLEDADLIMLDSPPAGVVADASILAPRVDGVILVLDATRTSREHARRAKEQLERVNAQILGAVLNRARVDTSGYRYQHGGRGIE